MRPVNHWNTFFSSILGVGFMVWGTKTDSTAYLWGGFGLITGRAFRLLLSDRDHPHLQMICAVYLTTMVPLAIYKFYGHTTFFAIVWGAGIAFLSASAFFECLKRPLLPHMVYLSRSAGFGFLAVDALYLSALIVTGNF